MKKYIPIILILVFSIVFLGLSKNENKDLKDNSKKDTKDIIIASYVNGVYTDELPTESKYFGYVKCFDNSGNEIDSLGFVTWENNKWNVKVTDISSSGTCNVYFIDPPAHWLDAESGTLLKAIKDNNTVENVKTRPGKEINKEDEAVLSGTLDDYGTSYFFRGNVKNNYVQFAGKCWQIVRVTGDGSIKLVLWNNANNCNSKNSIGNSKWNDSELETYETSSGEIKAVNSTNTGIGFMYGDANATNYFDAQANLHDSTILKRLKTWYDEAFQTDDEINPTKYTDLLADVIWCNDKSLHSGTGYGVTLSYFGGSNRGLHPSLVCPTSDKINGDIGNISRYTAKDLVNGNGMLKTLQESGSYKYYPIGLLTDDEMLFAGYKHNVGVNNGALSFADLSWTITPYDRSHILALYWTYISTENGGTSGDRPVRPSIALNYNVQATYNASSTDAPGTVNNPYVVSVN